MECFNSKLIKYLLTIGQIFYFLYNLNFDFVLNKNYTGYEDRSYYSFEKYDANFRIVMVIKKDQT
jgi:hypothetical protein